MIYQTKLTASLNNQYNDVVLLYVVLSYNV